MRPVEITEYFLEGFALMKDLYGKECFGRVTDHWYRFEFQNMGHLTYICCYIWLAPEHREKKVVVATVPRIPRQATERTGSVFANPLIYSEESEKM